MTSESSSMTMKSDNESKLVNTTSNTNNNNIYYNCNNSSSGNKSTGTTTTTTAVAAATTSTVISTANSATLNELPSITLAPFSKIKREPFDSSDYTRIPSSSSSMITKSVSNNNSQVPTAITAATAVANPTSVSAKMGSRRIFTPQFKLQVLESYRNDSDCKGNQRATARKYNIHRRQIQKWLQCESNLRSSVANISANNVKHQFHNITHQMPIVTTAASSSIHTNSNHHHAQHAHHNQQYKAINNRLSLDTTRHSVALTSIPTIPQSKAALAAAAAAVAGGGGTHQGVGDIGAVAPLLSPSPSSSSNTMKSLHVPTTSPILLNHHSQQILSKSAAESNAVQCSSSGSTSSSSKGAVIGGPIPLHTQYLHDSMGIHTPPALLTSVPVSVPIITPHPHTHLHVANLKSHHYHHLHMEQHHHHHHHHHNHNPYNQVPQPPPPQSSERRPPFMPSASLPALPTSSSSSLSSPSPSSPSSSATSPTMTAVALSCTDTMATTPAVALSSLAQAEENRIDELRDYQTTTTTAAATVVAAENRYMNENEYRTTHHQRAFEGFHYYMPLHMHPAAAAAMIAPIDLSLGTKRLVDYTFRENNNDYKRLGGVETTFIDETTKHEDDDNEDSQLNVVDSDFSESSVVDLTLRKRKVLMPTASSDPETISAEKHTKISAEEDTADKPPHEPAKTFKLFKPYLLGDDSSKSSDKETANKICKQKDPIIWSHHAACLSPPSSRGSNFQSPPATDAYPFPSGSPNFQPTINATNAVSFRCPKGSPVSGYESSSSIYSDSASSSDHYAHSHVAATTTSATTTYRFDLKVHNINGDLPSSKHQLMSPTDGCIPLPPATHNHVQRWLDQESGIRQSIALYV